MYSIRMEDLWMRVSYWSLLSWGLEADNTAFERKMRLYVLGLCAIFCRGKREMKKKKEIDLTRKTETRSSPHCVVDHIAISTEPLSLAK